MSRGLQSSFITNADILQPPEQKKLGPKSRARILINRIDPDTGERKDYPSSDPSPVITQETEISHAFTIRKFVEKEEKENSGEIDISNQDLWDVLKGLLGHYPHISRSLTSPYRHLILSWDKLEQTAKEKPKNDNDSQVRQDLKLLLDTISSSSGDPNLDKYFKTRNPSISEQKTVTYDNLWTIFPPGSLVYGCPFQGQDQVLIVRGCLPTWPKHLRPLGERPSWDLLCWTYDWDGKTFRRMCLKLKLEYFDGHKPITSLPYYPFELHEQRTLIKDSLITRGIKYRQVCTAAQGSRMFEYKGEAIYVKKVFAEYQGVDERLDFLRPRRLRDIEDLDEHLSSTYERPGLSASPPKSTSVSFISLVWGPHVTNFLRLRVESW